VGGGEGSAARFLYIRSLTGQVLGEDLGRRNALWECCRPKYRKVLKLPWMAVKKRKGGRSVKSRLLPGDQNLQCPRL